MASPTLNLSPQVPTSSEAAEAIHQTIQDQASKYDELRIAQALSHDDERKKDLDLDEVSEVVDLDVIDAGVRGSTDGNRVVIFVYEDETGRTAKGVVGYDELPRSAAAFEERRSTEVDAAKAARAAGGGEAFGEDPRVAVLTAEVERLRAEAKPPRTPRSKPSPQRSSRSKK